mmetsp:Transcript_10320/g.18991  ORF Transcript_10320/g.18991 Transcript_10320/m.18991 type:complete len:444 (-) Transcript_10320:83-1414(-)
MSGRFLPASSSEDENYEAYSDSDEDRTKLNEVTNAKALQNRVNLIEVADSDSDDSSVRAVSKPKKRSSKRKPVVVDSEADDSSSSDNDEEGQSKLNGYDVVRPVTSTSTETNRESKDEAGTEEGSDDETGVETPSKRSTFRYFGGGMKCHKCGEYGHIQAECIFGDEKLKCHICGKMGHKENACPKNVCFKCGRIGHSARSCKAQQAHIVNEAVAERRLQVVKEDLKYVLCISCNGLGHVNCKETSYSKLDANASSSRRGIPMTYEGQCSNCTGNHASEDCQNATIEQVWERDGHRPNVGVCYNCNKSGHIAAMCPYGTRRRYDRSPAPTGSHVFGGSSARSNRHTSIESAHYSHHNYNNSNYNYNKRSYDDTRGRQRQSWSNHEHRSRSRSRDYPQRGRGSGENDRDRHRSRDRDRSYDNQTRSRSYDRSSKSAYNNRRSQR